jgi:hypothetical protein
MTESQRNTANFGTSPVSGYQQIVGIERPPLGRVSNRDLDSGEFQFSFNENIKNSRFKSKDASPSPILDSRGKDSPILQELSHLQSKMREINTRLEHNLHVLHEKQQKNENLKKLLQMTEAKSTIPTDTSVIEAKCACKKVCVLI